MNQKKYIVTSALPYINGVKQLETAQAEPITLPPVINIGSNSDKANQVHATLDNIVVSKREFTEDEIYKLSKSDNIK